MYVYTVYEYMFKCLYTRINEDIVIVIRVENLDNKLFENMVAQKCVTVGDIWWPAS